MLVHVKNFASGQTTQTRLKAPHEKGRAGKNYAQKGLINFVESQHLFVSEAAEAEFNDLMNHNSDGS